MVDLTEQEKAALRHAVKMLAEVMEEVGWESRLIDLTETQVLTLAEVCVGGFQCYRSDNIHQPKPYAERSRAVASSRVIGIFKSFRLRPSSASASSTEVPLDL